MSYTTLSHVSTGDLATAALQNALIDDLAILKTPINDDGTLAPANISHPTAPALDFTRATVDAIKLLELLSGTNGGDLAIQTKVDGGALTEAIRFKADQSVLLAKLLDLSGSAAGQIKFPASQNASGNANTLDDYEEGTWTPILDSDGGTASGQTYSGRAGKYVTIGQLVYWSCFVALSNKGTVAAGNMVIKGLPFTSENVNPQHGAATIGAANNLATNWVSIGATVPFNDTKIYITGRAAAAASGANLQDTDFNVTTIYAFGCYAKA